MDYIRKKITPMNYSIIGTGFIMPRHAEAIYYTKGKIHIMYWRPNSDRIKILAKTCGIQILPLKHASTKSLRDEQNGDSPLLKKIVIFDA